MNTFETITSNAKLFFGLGALPQIRIAVPALSRTTAIDNMPDAQDQLARDELVQLFHSDLTAMKSLKPAKARKTKAPKNVICLRSSRIAALEGLRRAA
ncbi:hypothetical protein BDE40_1319 [Litoreibacter halocynthiae]|uniref:Uncharacterized protein n=1 Tax=Litoreibacter halocynthiae TaxID=1242689 RepID=A0A4V3EWS0_9RHOB|nr:hypothetical protein [Litoreibacter halocynthiae]TDT78015.1 hypothetical protein BDE40_1319 [Litoreibacter halocynthiae]